MPLAVAALRYQPGPQDLADDLFLRMVDHFGDSDLSG